MNYAVEKAIGRERETATSIERGFLSFDMHNGLSDAEGEAAETQT